MGVTRSGRSKRNTQCNEGMWSELMEELLQNIVRRFTCYIDNVRFGAVCRSWHSVIVGMHGHLTLSRDPWLMLPERKDNSMIRDFYIWSTKENFELKLPEIHAKRCVGSFKGWLVMVDASLSIHLFNPCTRVQLNLPHQMTFKDHKKYLKQGLTWEKLRDVFILKVVLSSSPTNPDCIAMAIYSDSCKLAIARPDRDETWTTIPSKWSTFVDAIFYKEQFYAISWDGTVVSCDVSADRMKTKLITAPESPISYGQKYLVERSGELLQVTREVTSEDDSFPGYKTAGFSVFKLDFPSKLWVEMKSLGDHSLFLGYNTSFSFCCNDSPATEVTRDCIYFTDDYLDGHHEDNGTSVGSDRGVFFLEDGHTELYFVGSDWHFPSLPLWFTPSKL